MTASGLPRLLAACVHVSIGATVFILLRETVGFRWLAPLDPVVCLTAAAAIVASWWLLPKFGRGPNGGVGFGVVAAAATAFILFIMMKMVLENWMVGKPVGLPTAGFWIGAALALFWGVWLISIATMVIACLAGGYVANLAARAAERSGRAGVASAALIAGVGLIVPAGALYGRTVQGMGFIDLVTRYDELRMFPARVEVALSVHGRQVLLERTVLCHRPLTFREELQARGELPEPYWLPSLKSFGQILADGSAVFVITPDGCRDLAIARDKDPQASLRNNILPSDFRPLIGRVPDGSNLATFDLHIDGTAYERPDAAVHIESVAMFRLPYGSHIDPIDAFAEVGWPSMYLGYGGYFANAIPPSVWRQYNFSARELEDVTKPSFVFGDLRSRRSLSNENSPPYGLRTLEIAEYGAPIPDESSRVVWKEYWGPNADEKRVAGLVVPLRRVGDTWQLYPGETGVITVYRGLTTTTMQNPLPGAVTVGGTSVRPQEDRGAGRYLYDPESGMLYVISSTYFRLAKPDSIFASW